MQYYRIGVITRAHGVRGGVRLQPLTDDPNRFKGLETAFLEHQGELRAVTLSEIGVRPDAITLQIEGIDTKEQAEALRGAYLAVDRAHARRLPPDTWFIADLIGCVVSDTDGKIYGTIEDVLQTGANDVYLLDTGSMIPALKRVLVEVDVEQKRMLVRPDVMQEVAVLAD